MPFFRRNRAIQKREKHEITWSNLAQNASTVQEITMFTVVQVADKNSATEVAVGSHTRGIYFEFHFSPQVVTNPKVIHWTIEYIPVGRTLSSPATYNNNTKSYIFKRGMEMLPADQATVFKRIFLVVIPKIYQRAKQGDAIKFRYISSSTETINACGIAIYKENY